MFLPERHLLTVLHSNPVRHSIRVLSDAPECAVFDLDDLEVDGFGPLGIGVVYDNADDAGWEEVADSLGREDDAIPIGHSVLSEWGEDARHGSGSEVCRSERQWRNDRV